MLKRFILCVLILVSIRCETLFAGIISEDIYQALSGKDVILTSTDGMDMRASFLNNNDDKIVVSDVEGEILVIEKIDIEHIKVYKGFDQEERPVKKALGVSVVDHLGVEKLMDRNTLFALQRQSYQSGRRLSRFGKLMIIPGWIVAGIGSFALLIGSAENSSPNVEGEDDSNSGAFTFGWTLTAIGLPLAIIGHIVKGKGNKKLKLAQEYEIQAQGLSYEMKPFVNPLSDSYGISFNVSF